MRTMVINWDTHLIYYYLYKRAEIAGRTVDIFIIVTMFISPMTM